MRTLIKTSAKNFHKSKKCSKGNNASFVTWISKVENVQGLKKYRLILLMENILVQYIINCIQTF